jgi:hypothetical protein
VRRRIAIGGLLLALFAALTWGALEAGGVGILETRRPDGGARRTHVWFAEAPGALWIEAATPDREWLLDIERSPRVILRWEGAAREFDAAAVPDPAARARLRALLRRKYGWRDRWVGLLQDTSRAVPVRLVPVAPPGRAADEPSGDARPSAGS